MKTHTVEVETFDEVEEWEKVAFEEENNDHALTSYYLLDFNLVLNKIKNVFEVSYNFFHGCS